MSDIETISILSKWLEIVPDAKHWCQNRLHNRKEQQSCLLGGLCEAAEEANERSYEAVMEAVATTIRRLHPITIRRSYADWAVITAFNDDDYTMYADVRRVVEATIAGLTG